MSSSKTISYVFYRLVTLLEALEAAESTYLLVVAIPRSFLQSDSFLWNVVSYPVPVNLELKGVLISAVSDVNL